jgi:hypothetical protein
VAPDPFIDQDGVPPSVDLQRGARRVDPCADTVRAYLLKVLQEYALHNGRADIIRERIDGSRGR